MARKQLYFVLHQVTTYEHEQQQQLSMLHANLKFRFLYLVDISCVLSRQSKFFYSFGLLTCSSVEQLVPQGAQEGALGKGKGKRHC